MLTSVYYVGILIVADTDGKSDLGAVKMAESSAKVEQTDQRPPQEKVRGKCPVCGEDLVSNSYYVEGEGYLIQWECWASLKEKPTCDYRRIL